jgi:hypothetical protein
LGFQVCEFLFNARPFPQPTPEWGQGKEDQFDPRGQPLLSETQNLVLVIEARSLWEAKEGFLEEMASELEDRWK